MCDWLPTGYISGKLIFTCRHILERVLQKVAETRIYVVEPSRAMVHLQHSRLHPYSKWPSDTFHFCKKFGGSEVLKFLSLKPLKFVPLSCVLTMLWNMSLTWKPFCPLAVSTILGMNSILSCPCIYLKSIFLIYKSGSMPNNDSNILSLYLRWHLCPPKACLDTVQYGVAVYFSLNADRVEHIREPCGRQPLDISSAKMKRGQVEGEINPRHSLTQWQKEKTSAMRHYSVVNPPPL